MSSSSVSSSTLPRKHTEALMDVIRGLVRRWADERKIFYGDIMSSGAMYLLASRVPTTMEELSDLVARGGVIDDDVVEKYGSSLVRAIGDYVIAENLGEEVIGRSRSLPTPMGGRSKKKRHRAGEDDEAGVTSRDRGSDEPSPQKDVTKSESASPKVHSSPIEVEVVGDRDADDDGPRRRAGPKRPKPSDEPSVPPTTKEGDDDAGEASRAARRRRRLASLAVSKLNNMRVADPVLELDLLRADGGDDDAQGRVIGLTNFELSDAVEPLPVGDFLAKCFRRKALHVRADRGGDRNVAPPGGRNRFAGIISEGMHHLDTAALLRETSSENIFVWLVRKKKGNEDGTDEEGAANVSTTQNGNEGNSKRVGGGGDSAPPKRLIRSVEIDDPDAAVALHDGGRGHALYCRAPPEVEQHLVSAMLRGTGMGCGQYDPSGTSTTCLGRGEVEVFFGTEGHCTDWHFDFQENFTLQLSGVKKWRLRQGTVDHPLRGCTPHYAAPDAVEGQLKAARLSNPDFEFGGPGHHAEEEESNAFGDEREVTLNPGDVLYHPAGMWHRVETVRAGVSMNVSLMATNYASLVTGAMQHLLLKDPTWRECVANCSRLSPGLTPAVDKLQRLLVEELPRVVKVMSAEGFAESILPPVLRFPPSFVTDNVNDDSAENGNDSDEAMEGERTSNAGSSTDHDGDGFGSRKSDSASDDDSAPIDVEDFVGPKGWECERPDSTFRLVKNPLATLMRMNDVTNFYESRSREGGTDRSKEYILNLGYGSNDGHESSARVVLREQDAEGALATCSECEMRGLDPSDFFCLDGKQPDLLLHEKKYKFKVRATKEPPPKCLFFYGYFRWASVDDSKRMDR